MKPPAAENAAYQHPPSAKSNACDGWADDDGCDIETCSSDRLLLGNESSSSTQPLLLAQPPPVREAQQVGRAQEQQQQSSRASSLSR